MIKDESWDLIIDSAKSKFDHESFLEELETSYGIQDKDVVFDALTRYAALQSQDIVISEIHQSLAGKGMNWPIEKMEEFFADKPKLWKNEILALNHLVVLKDDDDGIEITKEILAYPEE